MKNNLFSDRCLSAILSLTVLTISMFCTPQTLFAGNETITLKGHGQPVNAVTFSPDGRYILSASEDKTLNLWWTKTGELAHTFKGHTESVSAVVFSPDGLQFLSGSHDNTLKLWDVAAEEEIRTFRKEKKAEGKPVASSAGSSKKIATGVGSSKKITSVVFSPDGKLALSGSEDKTLKLWDITSGKLVRTFTGHTGVVSSVAFSPDGKMALSASHDKTLKLWEVETGKTLRTYKREVHTFTAVDGHSKQVNSVAFSPDGKLALSGGDDKTAKLWEVKTGRVIHSFKGHDGAVTSVAFSPDGKYALSGNENKVLQLWDVTTGKEVRTFSAHTGAVTAVAFSPDGQQILSGGRDGTAKLWDLRPSVNTPSPLVADNKPNKNITRPTIHITSHPVNRGIVTVPAVEETLVTGRVEDASGISELTVNGRSPILDAKGNFSIHLPLQLGRNEILIVAKNVHQNVSRKRFWLEATRQGNAETASLETRMIFSDQPGKYHALIIGNNKYEHLPELHTAINDATEIDRLLREKYGFTTTLLVDAGRSQIMNSLNEVRGRLGPEDNLIIYYAGHGEFDKTVGKAYWLPIDAQPDNDTNWIIVDNITSNIKRMSSRHILVVADSCYSGTLTRSAPTKLDTTRDKKRFIEKMKQRPSRTLMASGGNEPVADSGGKDGHSIFARAFIEALTDPGAQTFTAEQLFHNHIKEYVAGSAEQVPEYNIIKNSGHKGGDFVFVKK